MVCIYLPLGSQIFFSLDISMFLKSIKYSFFQILQGLGLHRISGSLNTVLQDSEAVQRTRTGLLLFATTMLALVV